MLTFGIKDILDIFLVALLLYYIWKLMKQSSAANIFTGVLFFVIGWIIVSRFLEALWTTWSTLVWWLWSFCFKKRYAISFQR